MLSPKFKRYGNQLLLFIVIWLVFGTIFTLLEYGILGDSKFYPSTSNPYSFKNNLNYVLPGCITMGLLQAYIELVWFKKKFLNTPLWIKILTKTAFYIILIIVFIIGISTINSMLTRNEGLFSKNVQEEISSFVSVFAFWSIVIYTGLSIFIALLFSEISNYLGSGVFYNFLLGKYHKPIEEVRIFMFLDMKSSTTIAEKIGHQKYFQLISNYYADMSDAILETYGNIYQYVGDEIVVSWTEEKGLVNNNCIECFFKIELAIQKRKNYYLNSFGVFPEFKAGYHIGPVTTGEIGVIKKDIIYTGDVLNTTARIQAECNNYNSRIIISKDLKERLNNTSKLKYKNIGELMLRGKEQAIELYDLQII